MPRDPRRRTAPPGIRGVLTRVSAGAATVLVALLASPTSPARAAGAGPTGPTGAATVSTPAPPAPPARGDTPAGSSSRPTLAVEDTLASRDAGPLAEILVTASRMTLDEILRRVALGEAQRDSLVRDQAFTLLVRVVGRDSKRDADTKSEPYYESSSRVYQKRPGKSRLIRLKEWSRDDGKRQSIEFRVGAGSEGDRKEHRSGVQVAVDGDMSEQFVGFAFDPRARARYRFRIEDRRILGDQVVYVLGFEPRSPLDLLPTGRAWVNTNDFVILREEFGFKDRSPAPLFLESLDSCVLERTCIDRRYWVISRVLARVVLADPTRWLARMGGSKVPKVADFAMARTDWIINGDVPDSLFAPAPAGERK